jgi:hypothetical protein
MMYSKGYGPYLPLRRLLRMNACRNLWPAIIPLAAILFGASPVVSQETTSPSSSAGAEQEPAILESVDVTAKREALRKAVTTFVSNVTIADGSNTARWREPICPSIIGTAPEQGDFIKARIRDISIAAGAKVAEAADCQANLLVFLTTQPDELIAQLKARNPGAFGSTSTEEISGAPPGTQPVRIWQSSDLTNADGTPPGTTYRMKDSRILSSVAEELAAVIIVVDTASTGAVTFGQLADYLSMVALAQVDLRAKLADSSTILQLFADNSADDAPHELTDWDRAFLKAVYGLQDSHLREPSVVTTRMLQDLNPQD